MTTKTHQGGIYEAAVKSMKFHLKRVIGTRVLDYHGFYTLLCKIEAILNSRPLTPLTDDPQDMQALTPAHFLIMREFVAPPPFQCATDKHLIGRKLWEARKQILDHFWVRWRQEYLVKQQERKKWRREKEEIKEGHLVLIVDVKTFQQLKWFAAQRFL